VRIHDGAYGTLLQRHLHGDETVDDLSLREPSLVIDAHRAYLEAGATAIQTNAFLAHLRTSTRRRRELQVAALDCAREAVVVAGSADAQVFATIGPAGTEPRAFWDDLDLLLGAEASGVQVETITDRRIADAFLAAWHEVARGVSGVTVHVGCSVSPSRGADAMRWVRELACDAPEDVVIGLNCCEGPLGLRTLLAELVELRGTAWAMPSAGLPIVEPGVPTRWPLGVPTDWAEAVAELVDGLELVGVGGCCGTTPDSIAALELG
jgi:methionine synthase I (cobalamin-dependent)